MGLPRRWGATRYSFPFFYPRKEEENKNREANVIFFRPGKSILDCSEANEGFYVKCGFKRAGLEMAHYYEKKE